MDKTYYKKMLGRGRLIPFIYESKLICFITFYITDNPDLYINRDNPWTILDDDEKGKFCYIDQLLTDKKSHWENHKLTYRVWRDFKNFIKTRYPQVKTIRWNRWKNEKVNTYKKEVVK